MAFNEAILADQRPNFFELLAEEQLREALRPALLYLVKVVAHSNPDLFSGLWRSRDEIHLILDSALQGIFLTLNDSSFSEHFYSLRRVGERESNRLNTRQICISFICLVLIPYLKVKVERLHSILNDENDLVRISWERGQSLKHLLKFLMFKSIPYLQSLWMLCRLSFHLKYLVLDSPYFSPLHWLAGVKLVHDQTSTVALSGRVWSWVGGQLLSLSLFSLRLLQWWYAGENEAAVRKMTSLPIPPPPPPTQEDLATPPTTQPTLGGESFPSSPLSCPLCHQKRREPTALATSGFVFCYDCISHHVRSHGTCPLTLSPTSLQQLVPLFFS